MRRIYRLTFVLGCLLLGVGLPVSANQGMASFEAMPCPVNFPASYTVECGLVTTAEEHANPDGATIKVAVAVFKTGSPNPLPDPVIVLVGGPGQNAIDQASDGLNPLWQIALQHRDVIILDQRGMGYSQPSLACPEVDQSKIRARFEAGSTSDPLEVEAASACYDRLVGEGANIAAFNTVESAGDIPDVIHALGYEEYNIWAGSYGSTLGMIAMRNHPEGIRSVMLTAVSPPGVDLMAGLPVNVQHGLDLLAESCANNPACVGAFPNLKGLLAATVDHLNEQPASIDFTYPPTGEKGTFVFSGDDLVAAVMFAMYDPSAVAYLPSMIAALAAGQYDVLLPLIHANRAGLTSNTDGAFYAMRCMDDVMTTTREVWGAAIDSLEPMLQGYWRASMNWWYDVCGIGWGAKGLDPGENTPVTSDIPTLMISGAFDPVTPASWADYAAETLSNSYRYVVPDSAHGAQPSPCAVDIYEQFLAEPGQEPDASCIDQMLGIPLIIPG